jgi:uncharacterized RDD family membrane protein YckC
VTTGVSAGFGRRIAALAYDVVLIAAIAMLYTLAAVTFTPGHEALLPQNVGGWAYLYRAGLVLIVAGYYIVNWTRSGQTLGMRAWRLHAVNAAGRPLNGAQALRRFAWGALAWSPAGLGVLWLYLDRDRLAIHDRLSSTRVVHRRRSRRQAPSLSRERDGDEGGDADRGRGQPADEHGVQPEQLAAVLHGAGDQEKCDSEQDPDDGARTGPGGAQRAEHEG